MRPLLAGTVSESDFKNLKFPVLLTPKLDGIRFLKIDGQLVSRTLKPIPNQYIQNLVKGLPDFIDGEIISGNFQQTTSLCMSDYKVGKFILYIFDSFESPLSPHVSRMSILQRMNLDKKTNEFEIKLLVPISVNNSQEILEFEEKCLLEGYEGVMIRNPNGKYKFGRSTLNEQILLKLKRFSDYEATVIGFNELLWNDNESIPDNLGLLKKQTLKENKTPANMLGSLIVQKDGVTFEIGSGFTEQLRNEIWFNKSKYLGKLVKFKTFEKTGVKDKPRFPTFLGFRSENDI